MDVALLLLRAVLAAILVTHAAQKTFGWFGGPGLGVMANVFERTLGLRPGRALVVIASIAEATAAVLLLVGLGTPVGAAMAVATMLVAGLAATAEARTIWVSKRGGEFAFVLAAIALAIGVAGPGSFSVDASLANWWVPFALAATPPWWVGAVVAATAFVVLVTFGMVIRATRRSLR